MRQQLCSGVSRTSIGLPDVNTVRPRGSGQINAIVQDKQCVCLLTYFCQPLPALNQLLVVEFLFSQLNDVDASLQSG